MRTAIIALIVAVAQMGTVGSTTAQPPRQGGLPAGCANAASQSALNACAARASRQADTALSAAYERSLAASGSASRRASLQTAQQAWLRYRDAHCRYVAATFSGGSAQPLEQSLCLLALSRSRTRELESPAGGGPTPPTRPGGGNETAQVRGSATYRERIAMPAAAVLHVRLEDVSRQDAPAVVVAERTIPMAGRQVPIPFTLPYDPSAIRENGRYVVRVSVRAGGTASSPESGSLLFTTTRSYPVITGGNPTTVEVMMDRVRPAAVPTPTPTPNPVQADPWEEARARGATFRAVGQEPGWILEIVEGGQISMVADYGKNRVTMPAPAPTAEVGGGLRYTSRTEAHRLDIRIQNRACRDVMSGESLPATVTATLDGRAYRGCGRSLR